ncbi:Transcriptional regulator, AcrR family [hydrothermal vent metagenome]|uniref:Transcriptional regulator, AcrR family n=1 Tax=hydrothermal vent metagenome TaxID=652676 RepID=A0A3B0T4C0_9ZZZZ
MTPREKQALRSKDALCGATIRCLDKYGYAKTSTSRITQEAGASRGALTHHFPTKEDLIVETTNRILRPVANLPKEPVPSEGQSSKEYELSMIKTELRRVWEQVANTAEARALLEILVAFRTDTKLRERIKPDLVRWNARMQQSILSGYASADGDDERLDRIWQIVRVFYRGLITQNAFVEDPGSLDEIMEEFVNMLAPMMQLRQSCE